MLPKRYFSRHILVCNEKIFLVDLKLLEYEHFQKFWMLPIAILYRHRGFFLQNINNNWTVSANCQWPQQRRYYCLKWSLWDMLLAHFTMKSILQGIWSSICDSRKSQQQSKILNPKLNFLSEFWNIDATVVLVTYSNYMKT